MPIYEYECTACGEPFEARVRMGTPHDAVVCPSCGARAARRVLSVFAGRFGHRQGGTTPGSRGCGLSGFG